MRDSPKEYASREQIERAREMRSNMPKAEVLLWVRLRGKQIGHGFRRQHPFGSYIVDFACVQARVAVELDGQSHESRVAYDRRRDTELRQLGWRVVRYLNTDVLNDLDSVLGDIKRHCDGKPPPYPPPEGEEPKTED